LPGKTYVDPKRSLKRKRDQSESGEDKRIGAELLTANGEELPNLREAASVEAEATSATGEGAQRPAREKGKEKITRRKSTRSLTVQKAEEREKRLRVEDEQKLVQDICIRKNLDLITFY